MRARRFAPLGLLAVAAALLGSIACRKPSSPKGRRSENNTPTHGGILRLATYSDLRTLDPAVAFDTETQPFLELLFAGLVDYDEDGKLVGDLAERWELSPDGKTYRFFIKKGVRMHDGSELTADDVKRSTERALHPTTPCPAIAFFEKLEGLEAYQAGKAESLSGVIVEGPHVVTYKLTAIDATFLAVLAMPFLRPTCKSAGTRYDDNFQTNACGAGPFMIDSWQPGRYLRLKRHTQYFVPDHPYLDGIEMRMDVSRLTQRFTFMSGEQDAILNEFERPGALYFLTHPEWSKYVFSTTDAAVFGDFMNVEMKPFDDVRMRKAVASALNRPNLQKYFEGWAVVTGHLLPPHIPGYDPNYPFAQKYDLQKARALMAEAGYPYDPATGKGGYPETIQYYASEGESAVRYAQILQYDLAQIGIRIEVKETSFAQWQALTGRPKTTSFGSAGWNLDYPDPSDFFEPIFISRAIAEEESQNHAFYRNPHLDDLVDRAHVELDEKKRLAMYFEAEKIVCDDAPWSFAYYPLRLELFQPWVRGYKPHPIIPKFFKETWIDAQGKSSTSALLGPGKQESALGVLLRSRHAPAVRR
jgi:ABC-type transport system substrate-binding protein